AFRRAVNVAVKEGAGDHSADLCKGRAFSPIPKLAAVAVRDVQHPHVASVRLLRRVCLHSQNDYRQSWISVLSSTYIFLVWDKHEEDIFRRLSFTSDGYLSRKATLAERELSQSHWRAGIER